MFRGAVGAAPRWIDAAETSWGNRTSPCWQALLLAGTLVIQMCVKPLRAPPAARSTRDGRLQEGERTGAAVEAHTRAQRNWDVDCVMADGKSADTGYVNLGRQAPEHIA